MVQIDYYISLIDNECSKHVIVECVMCQVKYSFEVLLLDLSHKFKLFFILSYLNLSLHRYAEQRNEVHDQNRPEHGNVEHIEERANDGDQRAPHDGVPELEFGQAPDEGTELLVGARRQFGTTVVSCEMVPRNCFQLVGSKAKSGEN